MILVRLQKKIWDKVYLRTCSRLEGCVLVEISYPARLMVAWRAANFAALHVAMQGGVTMALQYLFPFVRSKSASYCSTWLELARINESCQSSFGAVAGAEAETGRSLVATRCHGVLHVVGLLSAVLFILSTNLINCFTQCLILRLIHFTRRSSVGCSDETCCI